ncbi:hypothetical protein C7444_114102 [Sphaerotilus hippei]|uniref:Uncharacterized protein n=1 Tax=Sphaerotilus hippei TaxID=744406 RepID=A0A318GXD3_9BURK|nr:hypothetical protein [Sphaerotilus hippei]PXW94403.1 hypothetical protein C7444_114102 [Sphaerotilus hippei]
MTAPSPASPVEHGPWLADFAEAVQRGRAGLMQRYREQVHAALSSQQAEDLTLNAVLAVMDAFHGEALARLAGGPATAHLPVEAGRHRLTPEVLAPFRGSAEALVTEVVKFNNTSCALSNFPQEHRPSTATLALIRRELAATWRDFALRANALLCEHRG